ncbi:hypothetical protein ACIG47_03155 [Promicromonospora sp. NPDC052451]|uniref:hypothetical protein n=1 Tax=Promicromonospora sp. NPDC052451 TaxID=3364407 RepID=UPI0037CC99CC
MTPNLMPTTSKAPALLETSPLVVLRIVTAILELVGPEKVELVTFTRDRISLHPVNLEDGEGIARLLGCDLPLDHRMFVPGHTLWTGVIDGLEVQVRSALRQVVAR